MRSFHKLFADPEVSVGLPTKVVTGLSSTERDVQRAAISKLRSFVNGLFFYRFDNYFYVSILTVAGILILLIIVGLPVALHRLYHGRLAPCRFVHHSRVFYIVPNAINCFILLESAYGVALIVAYLSTWKAFHDHMSFWVKLFPALRVLIWLPLYMGAFLTGWGSLFTAPDVMDKLSSSQHKRSAGRHLPLSMIVNLSCWGTPFVLTFSLLVPVLLACIRLGNAFDRHVDWDRQLQAVLDTTPADALVRLEMVDKLRSEATSIFREWTTSAYYVGITNILWSFWALLFLLFYIPAGGLLVHLLFGQVRRQRKMLLNSQRNLEPYPAQETRQMPVTLLSIGAARQGQNAQENSRTCTPLKNTYEDRSVSLGNEETDHIAVLCTNSQEMAGADPSLSPEGNTISSTNENNEMRATIRPDEATSLIREDHKSSTAVGAEGRPDLAAPKICSSSRKLLRMDRPVRSEKDEVLPHKSITAKLASKSSGPLARYTYLRRCLVNLLILYVGIIWATCCFTVTILYLANTEYRHAMQGPDELARSLSVAGTAAAWTTAVFGVLTTGSIVFRNFDNFEAEAVQHGGEDGGILRCFHMRRSESPVTGSECLDPAPDPRAASAVDTTRNMPAVPESVDLEASMLSRLPSRPRLAKSNSVRFSIATQPHAAGGLVMRPVDQVASNFRGSEAQA